VRAPRKRWLRKLDGRDHVQHFLAHPLGLVAATNHRTILLDPDTGEKRCDLPALASWYNVLAQPLIVREVLLQRLANDDLGAFDLATGERLDSSLRHLACSLVAPGLLVTIFDVFLQAYRIADARRTPELAWTFEYPTNSVQEVTASSTHVIVPFQHEVAVLDHDGAVCWSAENERRGGGTLVCDVADEDLVLLARNGRGGRDLEARDADSGRVRWRREEPLVACALTPGGVVVTFEGETRVLDRATGETRAWFSGARALPRRSAVARDVVHHLTPGEVVAHDTTSGRMLWRIGAGELGRAAPRALAVTPGRVHVAGNRFVACFEEGP